jgi:ribosomal protein L37AE/L43A
MSPSAFEEYLRSELEVLDKQTCAIDYTPPEAGEKCPECKKGTLEFDGMLNIVCSECDYVIAGVCT